MANWGPAASAACVLHLRQAASTSYWQTSTLYWDQYSLQGSDQYLLKSDQSFLCVRIRDDVEGPQPVSIQDPVVHLSVWTNIQIQSFDLGDHSGNQFRLWNSELVTLCRDRHRCTRAQVNTHLIQHGERVMSSLTAGEARRVVIDVSQHHGDRGGSGQAAHLTNHIFGLDNQQEMIPHLSVHVRKSRPHHTCRTRPTPLRDQQTRR